MEQLHHKRYIEDLRAIPLFAHCSDRELMALLGFPWRRQVFDAGSVIMARGDRSQSLMLLISGRVSLIVEGSCARVLVVERLSASRILNLSNLLSSDQMVDVDYVADTECCVWFMSRVGFMNLMMNDGNVALCVARLVSDRNRMLVDRMRSLATETLKVRIVEYLASVGEIRNIGATAALLGVTRPSLSRVLNAMIHSGELQRVAFDVVILPKRL